MTTDSANIVYGRLKEAAHISGYTFARTSEWLETLLADGAWRTVGPGFTDVNLFLRSIDLSPFNIGDNRPALVRRIKELQPDASTRAIGAAVGVSHQTVHRDLQPQPVTDVTPEPESLIEDDEPFADLPEDDEPVTDVTPDPEAERLQRLRESLADEERRNPDKPVAELLELQRALRAAVSKLRAMKDAGQDFNAAPLAQRITDLCREIEELLCPLGRRTNARSVRCRGRNLSAWH